MNTNDVLNKLIAEIEKRKYEWQAILDKNKNANSEVIRNIIYEDENTLDIIRSLQQEQPEIELEKEICEYFEGWRINYYSETEELLKNNGCTVDIYDVKDIARHFYELGLKTQ